MKPTRCDATRDGKQCTRDREPPHVVHRATKDPDDPGWRARRGDPTGASGKPREPEPWRKSAGGPRYENNPLTRRKIADAVAVEREACAAIADDVGASRSDGAAEEIAALIRARG